MDIKYCKKQLEAWIEYKQISKIKEHISKEDEELIIKQAEELMKQIFTFDKPWDMERCIVPYQFEKMDWNAQRNDDEEWCFMLNRMDYLNYLMLAGYLKEDKKYIQKGKELILDWIAFHQEILPSCSTRTLDTGIRIMNFAETLPYIYRADILSDEELEIIITSIDLQIQYLKDHYLTKYTLSNWGSIQTCAIISIMPLYLSNYEKNEIYQWARKEIEVQFGIQVYDDGMQWEQSTMYHIEVLNYGMKALFYDCFYQHEELPILKQQVEKLANALFYQATLSFEIETFGDSDRACIKDVMTRAASLYQNGIWKFGGYPQYDVESLYIFGVREAIHYQELTTIQPTQRVFDGEDSGMYTMRSAWTKQASFTMFTNGSLGSGHGHSDNLHISLYHQGVPVLIDPGRYTYREDHPLRVILKSMPSHNSVIVDKKQSCLPSDSWGYHDFGIPTKNYVRHNENIHYVEGNLYSHDPLQIWTRKVIVIDPSIWMIVDEVKEDGAHDIESYFHVDPMMKAKIEDDHILLEGDTKLKMYTKGIKEIESKPCSLRYNELLHHDVITLKDTFTDHYENITIICAEGIHVTPVDILQNQDTPMLKDITSAYRFTLSEDESYTIAIFHKEIFKGKKICYCEGMPFHAKCIVVHQKGTHKELIRLRA